MDAFYVWIARGLVVVLLFVFILGVNWIQQRMHNYSGKAAIRLLWLSTISPWRAKEVETDFLRQGFPIIIWLFSITLLGVGTATYFMSPLLLLGVFQFLLFIVVLLLVFFVSTTINEKGSYIIAALGPTTLLIGLILGLGSIIGFFHLFLLIAVNPVVQISISISGLILLCWQFVTILFVSNKALDISFPSALGRLLIIMGLVLMMVGVTIGTIGSEGINLLIQQLALLPTEFLLYIQHVFQSCFFLSNPWNLFNIGAILIVFGALFWVIDNLRNRRLGEASEVSEPKD